MSGCEEHEGLAASSGTDLAGTTRVLIPINTVSARQAMASATALLAGLYRNKRNLDMLALGAFPAKRLVEFTAPGQAFSSRP